MKILITGATGFVGQGLVKKLISQGHSVRLVCRKEDEARKIFSEPVDTVKLDLTKQELPLHAFDQIDTVVHLLGESINGYWTKAKKELILNSRKLSSSNLLKNLPPHVKTVFSTSAVGYYGDRKNENLDENSSAGSGFLSEVCQAWESPFLKLDQRVIIFRFGLVMSIHGGALAKMISIFDKNLGCVLGSGQQWLSWISHEDLIQLFSEALVNPKYAGIINAVHPLPLQNKDFTHILCKTLNKFQMPHAPKLALKLILGEMSSLVLDSQKVNCKRLKELGFQFKEKDFESFLLKQLS